MRAVFTIDLPQVEGKYVEDNQLVKVVRGFGWELKRMDHLEASDIRAIMGTRQSPAHHPSEAHAKDSVTLPPHDGSSDAVIGPREENIEQYKRLAGELFEDMPEVAAAEKEAVIFTGYLSAEQVLFVITRMVPAQVTFRLLHREFPRLRAATEKMMAKVISARLNRPPVHIINPTVSIYERGHDHVIINGRVITQPLKETFHNNLKDTLLFAVPLLLAIPTIFVALHFPDPKLAPQVFWKGMVDRLSTALLTASLVSLLGLLQTWVQIRRGRIIDWDLGKRA